MASKPALVQAAVWASPRYSPELVGEAPGVAHRRAGQAERQQPGEERSALGAEAVGGPCEQLGGPVEPVGLGAEDPRRAAAVAPSVRAPQMVAASVFVQP